MRIFFYSTVFAPNVGGIEALVEMLCRHFVALGHEVVVATETSSSDDETGWFPLTVVRQPSFRRMRRLLTWCDVHVQANVSLKAAWVWLVIPRKTIYQHNSGYQRDDGSRRLTDVVKTRLATATPGIANSTYTALKTGAENVIFNAYDDETFGTAPNQREKDLDLVFLGRLVSQKGCDTLVDALAQLARQGLRPGLTIIGDGPDRPSLERQIVASGLAEQVRFLGSVKGQALARELSRHRVHVIPSRFEEPFGIVALEGLASGCVPVVSEHGGLTDAIGGHGFTFPNGDATVLADTLHEVLRDIETARTRLIGVEAHLARCRACAVAQRYIEVFERHLGSR